MNEVERKWLFFISGLVTMPIAFGIFNLFAKIGIVSSLTISIPSVLAVLTALGAFWFVASNSKEAKPFLKGAMVSAVLFFLMIVFV